MGICSEEKTLNGYRRLGCPLDGLPYKGTPDIKAVNAYRNITSAFNSENAVIPFLLQVLS
jgi:hypothetical protein